MVTVLVVGCGGFLGSICRYLLSLSLKDHIPYPTMLINLVGSLLIGIFLSFLDPKEPSPFLAFLLPGFLGGFTTFSAFSGETVLLLSEGQYLSASAYVLFTLFGGISLCAAGMYLGKMMS